MGERAKNRSRETVRGPQPSEPAGEGGARSSVGLTLRANFSWTIVGNVVFGACQWGLLVVLAKLGSPEMVGQFALALAIAAPIIICFRLDLRAVKATDAEGEYPFGVYLGLRLATTMVALLVIVAIGLLAGYRWETALVIVGVGVAKAVESVSDVIYGLLQQRERMDCIATSMMLRGALSLAALGTGTYATGSVVWGVAGLVAAWTAVLFGYDLPRAAWVMRRAKRSSGVVAAPMPASTAAVLRPHWDFARLVDLARLALPLGVVTFLVSLNANVPRYVIERDLGERELGIFAAMAYLVVAGGMVVAAMGQSAVPRLARYYSAGADGAFRGLMLKLTAVGAGLGVAGLLVALLAGELVLTVLYRPEYAQYVDVFAWLMVAAIIEYVGALLGYGITATRAFGRFVVPYSLVTGVALVASLVLIPIYGLVGAAWALIAVRLAACAAPLAIFAAVRREGT